MSQTALRLNTLPNEDDLPCDDGQPMETARHRMQMELLLQSLEPWAARRGDCYLGGNMFLYFSEAQLRGQDFLGPDFYAVLGVSPHHRKSWVVWAEGKAPDLVIELLSESTAKFDKGDKKRIYQDQVRVAEYFWFDPYNPQDFAGFRLDDGRYRPLLPTAPGRIPSPLLGLALGWWDGDFHGDDTRWLRWYTADGELLPTHTELAQAHARQEQARADEAEAYARQEQAKAEQAQAHARQEQAKAEQAQAHARQEQANAERARIEAQQAQALARQEQARAEQAEREALQQKLGAQAAQVAAAQARAEAHAEQARAVAAEQRAAELAAELARLRADRQGPASG